SPTRLTAESIGSIRRTVTAVPAGMVTRRGSGTAGVAAAALVVPSAFNGLAAGAGGYGHGAGGDWLYQFVFTLFARGLACAALGLAAVCSLLASGVGACAWFSSGA